MAEQTKTSSVTYYAPDDLETLFSDNLGVVYAHDRLYLQFFQAQPPIVVQPGNDVPVEKSKCVARIVVTPQAMALMVDAMHKGLDGYRANHARIAEQGETDG